MARLDEFCEHVLVHTGQNYDYELNQVFWLGVYPGLDDARISHMLSCFRDLAKSRPLQTV